jgi:heat shock protein HslJ
MRSALIFCLLLIVASSPFVLAGKSPVLESIPWKMVSYLDIKGRTIPALTGGEVTTTFQSGAISSSDGCNRFGAVYSVSENTLTIKPGPSTMMVCAPKIMDQARGYLAALSNSSTYRIESDKLELRDAKGSVQASYLARR